ncbi:Protein of unknown function (DUF2911) [Maribacter vaceletii]|uniref:DUF2911 family protein n=1 Tax=Maribacter vaceletii TaxID=1206816 RepID=A0A495E665_9FLAO|nr:DUF2911 domain-containing protein [Maribacter vaceletii]RKR12434.1 Protein of unknown function (DUF2911) [Maribacter vaceletii]
MKNLLVLFTLMLSLAFTTNTNAQKFNDLDRSPMDMATFPSSYKISEKIVRVIYSRPQLKGRSISQLAPAGEIWRTGANEASEITFYKDVKIADNDIKAGTYALFTIPGEKEWTIILNSKLNQWGAYTYEKADDVLRVNVNASTAKETLDAFSISFQEKEDGAALVMGWDTTRVTVPVSL